MGSPSVVPKKSLGQHFLYDENIAREIAAAIDPRPGDVVLEIGPGEGVLTKYIAGRVRSLVLVELDRRIATSLEKAFELPGVAVRQEDILKTDLTGIAAMAGSRLRIAGNIPYYITSPILFHLLDHRAAINDVTMMMQREVARRLAARPKSKAYGILSVFCQLYADVSILFDVGPQAFFPRPRVFSSVVRLNFLSQPRCAVTDEAFFRTMVRAVFGKRRKMLRNSLAYFFDEPVADGETTIELGRRPEELTLNELALLSNELYAHRTRSSLLRYPS